MINDQYFHSEYTFMPTSIPSTGSDGVRGDSKGNKWEVHGDVPDVLPASLIRVEPLEDITITGFRHIPDRVFETQLAKNTITSKKARQRKRPRKESLRSGGISQRVLREPRKSGPPKEYWKVKT